MMHRVMISVVMLITAGLQVSPANAADLVAGEALASEQCNSCHVMPGEVVGFSQARALGDVVQVVDWNHLRLREWFATGHPVRLSFQVTDVDLHDLRFYLMDLRSKSMLGGLATP